MSNCTTCNGNVSAQVNRVSRADFENRQSAVTYMPVKTTQQTNAYQQRIQQILQAKTVQAQKISNQVNHIYR